MSSLRHCTLWLAAAALALPLALYAKDDMLVYIGTYTRDKSKGIYAFRFDSSSGRLSPLGLAAETVNPSFLAMHPNGRLLYAVSETYARPGERTGAVSAFAIDKASGKLALLNTVESKGTGPCHLNVDKTGRNLLVANYGSGSAAAFPLNDDGSLREASSVMQHSGSSVDPKRQQGPHAHSINLSADNRFAVVADLGLDQVLVYRFDPAAGTLSANDPPFVRVEPGGGPRHFAFHPSGKFAYVINEMRSSVTALSWDGARGSFTALGSVSTLPQDFTGNNSTAEVQVHRSGKFVYGSNRGHNSIAVFRVDRKKGTLTPAGHADTQGQVPRNFGIDPRGRFLIAANQNTDNLVVFRIDQKTGNLAPTGQSVEVGAPVCVKFLRLP